MKRIGSWPTAWLLALMTSCGPSAMPAPAMPSDDPAFVEAKPITKPGMDDTEQQAPDNLIPGDVLDVQILGATDMPQVKVTVDRSGYIHLPLIGDVEVGGKTLTEAEKLVQQKLRKYDRISTVSLTLLESKARRVVVTGAVTRPGNVPIEGDERLAEVLAAAGGPKMATIDDRLVNLADMSGAQLVREGKPLPIDFELALRGDPRHNVRVRPGDVIRVPPVVAGRVVVLGHVNRPRTLMYQKGMKLSEALAEAGGLSKSADSQDIRIIRGGFRHPKLYVANARAFFEGKRPDVVLAPGDIIYVSKHWFATVGEVIDRVVPAVATAAVITTLTRGK